MPRPFRYFSLSFSLYQYVHSLLVRLQLRYSDIHFLYFHSVWGLNFNPFPVSSKKKKYVESVTRHTLTNVAHNRIRVQITATNSAALFVWRSPLSNAADSLLERG